MGILPDVRLLPCSPRWEVEVPQTYEEAVHLALQGRWLRHDDQARARGLIETHFHELFQQNPQGFRPLWYSGGRELLITWQTGERGR